MIRFKIPDKKNALSKIEASERDMKFTLTLEVSDASGSTIIRNVYECFRMLGDALIVAERKEVNDHIAPIKELTSINVKTSRPIRLIENLRRLRHNINYNGYKPKIQEIEDTISLSKSCYVPLLKKVREIIER